MTVRQWDIMRVRGPLVVCLFLMAIQPGARAFSLLTDPSLDSLLDGEDDTSSSAGCETYGSPYWDQIERAARRKLSQMKGIKGRSGEKEKEKERERVRGRERRDSYDHDDTQVVVRCKHGYTGW